MAVSPEVMNALSEMNVDDNAVASVINLQRNLDMEKAKTADLTDKLATMTADRDALASELEDTKRAVIQQAAANVAQQQRLDDAATSSSSSSGVTSQTSDTWNNGGTVSNGGTIA